MTQIEKADQQPTSADDDSKAQSKGLKKPRPGLFRTLRRNNRGCKSSDFYDWPYQSLEDMDSTLAVQQYIQQLIHEDPSDVDEILRLPEGQDLGPWKVEHLRLFCMQLNNLACRLQDCCDPVTCNQMTATEQWIFLCAAHKQPIECSAIDYTRHTLDSAATLINNNKYFPSRVTIKESSVAKLGSVCRRVYRIFSHAYYHHYPVFEEFESENHLCRRFSRFVTMYELMSKESLIVPSDGSKPSDTTDATWADTSTIESGDKANITAVTSGTLRPTTISSTSGAKQKFEEDEENTTPDDAVKSEVDSNAQRNIVSSASNPIFTGCLKNDNF